MRVVTSKALLTAVAGLIAVPGAAIAAADPDTALLQFGSSNEEVDCEEYEDDLDAPDAEEHEDDLDAPDAEVPEECLVSDEDDDADDADEAGEEQDGDESNGGSEDADEAEDAEDAEDADEGVDEEAGVEDVDADETSELHGEIVSTVAHCAPRGQERVDGFDLPNLGAYVSTAARGEVLSVEAGEFDLSTLEGAEQLCEAIDQARADAADESSVDDAESGGTAPADAATTSPEQRGKGNGNGNGNGVGHQDGGPGNSGNAPGRNR